MTSKVIAIDSETTDTGPNRRIWDLALIVLGEDRPTDARAGGMPGRPGAYQWYIDVEDLDLGNANPFSLNVGKFYERHPQMNLSSQGLVRREVEVLRQVERLTRGAHLLGAVPNFDADVLDRRMRAHGILPSWHYHLCDIEAMAVGYLHGTGYAAEFPDRMTLPWKSDELSRACGVEPPSEDERHSALADADWALRWYEAITGSRS